MENFQVSENAVSKSMKMSRFLQGDLHRHSTVIQINPFFSFPGSHLFEWTTNSIRIYTMEIAWSYIILDHEGLWVLFGYLFTFLPSSDERIHTTKVVLHW